jgi:hypothetical protein
MASRPRSRPRRHEGNVGYGSRLDSVVTWILSRVENGTRLRLVHSGFVTPKNDSAFKNMSEGWLKVHAADWEHGRRAAATA